MRTTAAIVRSPKASFEVTGIRLDDLQPDEVLVDVKACGICHMDIEAKAFMPLPIVLGHEGAGVILDVGADVHNIAVGDRVILGYGFCGSCAACQERRPFFCDEGWNLTFGGKRKDGSATAFDKDGNPITAAFFQQSSFAHHAITPARGVIKIPDDVPWHVAAAIPCSFLTGIGTAQNILKVDGEATLMVAGVGAVGIGAIVGAKIMGCSNIVATDIKDNRLAIAQDFGATTVVNVRDCDFGAWRAKNMPRGFSHVVDTTGNAPAFHQSIESLATGGHMAYAILPAPMEEFSFQPFELFTKCASLTAISFGSAAPVELLPKMLEWWSSGEFPVESVVSTFDFRDINDAVDAVTSGAVIKSVLLMD